MRGLIWMLLILWFTACKKEQPEPEVPTPAVPGKGVFVLNEGNFMWGNASLTYIRPDSNIVHEDVFSAVNNRPLGDVLQSAARIGDELWLIVNNSQKIERIRLGTHESVGTITGLHSPRYALEVRPGVVYVTDLYANRIHILDASGNITGHIPVSGWTEELLLLHNEVWVCNAGARLVYRINPEMHQIVDSVSVGDVPRWIRSDLQGQIWVLCEGQIPPNETAGSLCRIEPSSPHSAWVRTFPNDGVHPSRLCRNTAGNTLYWLRGGVFRQTSSDSVLSTQPLIEAGSRIWYGLAVHPEDESVWLSDARDYVQKGKVYRYTAEGTETGVWEAGIIPGSFYFY